ncbi:hypothetical protein ABZP36_023812 [Zizania latifolia]
MCRRGRVLTALSVIHSSSSPHLQLRPRSSPASPVRPPAAHTAPAGRPAAGVPLWKLLSSYAPRQRSFTRVAAA